MAGFPPLAHPMEKYTKIVERDAYAVIFAELIRKVKLGFEAKHGESRFYLYCIFQLLLGHQVEVKELATFDLVLNFGNKYHKFRAESMDFIKLNEVEVLSLQDQHRVLRLIEGKSSELTGWKGISILFASPGLDGMNDYAKVDSFTYILPAWTFEELQDYNFLLDNGFKVAEDVLISRYNKFGGIPRFIFTSTELENEEELSKAIATFSALDIISYAKNNHAVRDGNYSHRVLEMVPSLENFRAKFHLDFLSKYIAEQIVSRVTEDSIQKVSEFAIAHADDDSGCTSVPAQAAHATTASAVFGDNMGHHFERDANGTLLLSGRHQSSQKCTYYRPTSKTFGALDAFVILGNDCIGLQMTLNQNHGIKAAPLNTFLEWLKGVGIAKDLFYFAFVVPSHLVGSFKKQTIRTKTDSITKKPGASATVKQYVAALDVFVGGD
ncbi:hypothetical protein GQ600_1280 [Phytophthora cactorum]|nr:hypothetical protein GQ600_1280 [Phytophthora cactorum]